MAEASDLLTGDIKRRLHHLEVKLKSAALEGAFKLISRDRKVRPRATDQSPGWGEHQIYAVDYGANGFIATLPGFTAGRFDLWGSRELVMARAPKFNLAPFLTVGLAEGVTLKIPTVISDPQLNEYLEGLKAAVRQFYIDYLKESSVSIRITTETING